MNGNVNWRFFYATTEVAPVKALVLSGLKHCAAYIATKLFKTIKQAFNVPYIKIDSVTAWSVLTSVMSWPSDLLSKRTIFLANRVSEIQETLPPNVWRHISRQNNPAECASRGIPPSEIHNNLLHIIPNPEEIPETRKSQYITAIVEDPVVNSVDSQAGRKIHARQLLCWKLLDGWGEKWQLFSGCMLGTSRKRQPLCFLSIKIKNFQHRFCWKGNQYKVLKTF